MWGIIPVADTRSPMHSYLVERMLRAGATRICFVLSPGTFDVLEHYGGSIGLAHVSYTVQPKATGLCDSIFRALPMIHPDDEVLVGLPATIGFPENALCTLPRGVLSFLLVPAKAPERFDAVITDDFGWVREIQSQQTDAASDWIW